VHRLDIKIEQDYRRLEDFLNSLKGEVVSIIPNVARTTLMQLYGGSSKVNFVLVVEKLV